MAAAATTALPFFLISLLFISCSHTISCFAIATTTPKGQGQWQGQVPSSVTPKAAAVHYWHIKTRNTKPPPPIFLSKLSPISPFKLITTTNDETMRAINKGNKVKMQKIDDQNAIIYTHAAASVDMKKIDDQNAIIYTHAPHDRHPTANDDMEKIDDTFVYASSEKTDDQNAIIYTHAPHDRHPTANDDMEKFDDTFVYAPHHHHLSTSHDAKITTKHRNFDSNINIKMVAGDELKEADQNRPNSRGTFYFKESELKEGKMISSLKFVGRGSSQYFLPRSIASKIPFSASAVGKIFHIPTDSAMHRAMKTTIGLCRMPPNTGETKLCATSAEDMIDYALSTLGANTDIRVWSTHNLSGFGGKSLIGKVNVVYDGELTAKSHVTCHKETFPYLVYACHDVFKTRVYDLEILDAETKEKTNQGAALCHLDTSAWSPDHASFAAVGSAPGKTEVCHWIAPWDMVWTAGHVAE